ELAIWDPAFVGTKSRTDTMWDVPKVATPDEDDDITLAGGGANMSYATHPLMGRRSSRYWSQTLSASDPVYANRGPRYTAQNENDPENPQWQLVGTPTGGQTNADVVEGYQSNTL